MSRKGQLELKGNLAKPLSGRPPLPRTHRAFSHNSGKSRLCTYFNLRATAPTVCMFVSVKRSRATRRGRRAMVDMRCMRGAGGERVSRKRLHVHAPPPFPPCAPSQRARATRALAVMSLCSLGAPQEHRDISLNPCMNFFLPMRQSTVRPFPAESPDIDT